MDHYYSIQSIEEVLYKDKGSKFFGFAYPVTYENDIKQKLEHVKNIHPKATHYCYAYRLGHDKNNFRTQDDGEPNGTAGKPILGQIDSFGISNCLIIIVRYFGGTRLGVSGLIDAYKTCAKQTIESTTINKQSILSYYSISCPYSNLQKIFKLVNYYHASIKEQQIDNPSRFIISIEQNLANVMEQKLLDEQFEFKYLGKQ